MPEAELAACLKLACSWLAELAGGKAGWGPGLLEAEFAGGGAYRRLSWQLACSLLAEAVELTGGCGAYRRLSWQLACSLLAERATG